MINTTAIAIAGAALVITYAIQWAGALMVPRFKPRRLIVIQANICRWGGALLLVAAVILSVVQR